MQLPSKTHNTNPSDCGHSLSPFVCEGSRNSILDFYTSGLSTIYISFQGWTIYIYQEATRHSSWFLLHARLGLHHKQKCSTLIKTWAYCCERVEFKGIFWCCYVESNSAIVEVPENCCRWANEGENLPLEEEEHANSLHY